MDVEVQQGRLAVHLVPEALQHTGVSVGQRQRAGEPSLEPAYEERIQYSEEAAVHFAVDYKESAVVYLMVEKVRQQVQAGLLYLLTRLEDRGTEEDRHLLQIFLAEEDCHSSRLRICKRNKQIT